MFSYYQLQSLSAFSVYLCALTSCAFCLAGIYCFVPRSRLRTQILKFNQALLFSGLLNFALGLYTTYHALLLDVNINLQRMPERLQFRLTLVLIFITSMFIRTFSEMVLLFRVQAVYPRKLSWHLFGLFLISLRTLLDLLGKLLISFHSPPIYFILYLAIILEVINNLLFTGIFFYRISKAASKRKRFIKLRLLVLENSLLPTACSFLNLVMLISDVDPNGWQLASLFAYVVGIPAASIFTTKLASQNTDYNGDGDGDDDDDDEGMEQKPNTPNSKKNSIYEVENPSDEYFNPLHHVNSTTNL